MAKTTLELAQEAYAKLSDEEKKKFHQSLPDRVDESVGETLADEGAEDSESAKARIDEAVGAEKADHEEAEEHAEEAHEEQPAEPEHEEHHDDLVAKLSELEQRLDHVIARLDGMAQKPTQAADEQASKLDKLTAQWTN